MLGAVGLACFLLLFRRVFFRMPTAAVGWAFIAIALYFGGQAPVPKPQNAAEEEALRSKSMPVVITQGDENTPTDILLFLHGWPDTPYVWQRQFDHFCTDSSRRILCKALVMPGYYPGADPVPGTGFDFDELGDMLANSTRAVRSSFPKARVTLVSHDWGAWIGYVVANTRPELFDAMVPLDVGPGAGPRTDDNGAFWAAKILYYQLLNVDCYFASKIPIVGVRFANFALRSFTKVVMQGLFGMPTPTPFNLISHTMAYPYVQVWKEGSPGSSKFVTLGYAEMEGVQEVPSQPTLFLAGGHGVNLHGKKWFQGIHDKASSDGVSKAHILSECHHWLMHFCADTVNAEIEGFVLRLKDKHTK